MRRSERAITDPAELESILREAVVCRMGLCDGEVPYVVPMNYGYRDGSVFLHSAAEGRKIEILRKNPNVCLEFEKDVELIPAEAACSFSMKYRSVIASGKAVFLEDVEEKAKGLNVIMAQYTGKEYEFPPQALKRIVVIRVDLEECSGKHNGY
jgi:nitroimidazol reductase NimA-like FMN-containing flavoprotein (pyridoxamine 5'-phosphate oxidase superfamily)